MVVTIQQTINTALTMDDIFPVMQPLEVVISLVKASVEPVAIEYVIETKSFLSQYITQIFTLFGVLAGGLISFFTTVYKHKKDIEKENKKIKLEKFIELYAISDECRNWCVKLFQSKINARLSLSEILAALPSSTFIKQASITCQIHIPELVGHIEKISDGMTDIIGSLKNSIESSSSSRELDCTVYELLKKRDFFDNSMILPDFYMALHELEKEIRVISKAIHL